MSVYVNAGDFRSGQADSDNSVPVVLSTDHPPIATVPAAVQASELIINENTSGDRIIIPSVVDFEHRVLKLFFVTKGKVSISFKSGATLLAGPLDFDKGSLFLDFDNVPWFTTAAGQPFVMNLSAAVLTLGRIYYVSIDTTP